jgi:hypothetical protein
MRINHPHPKERSIAQMLFDSLGKRMYNLTKKVHCLPLGMGNLHSDAERLCFSASTAALETGFGAFMLSHTMTETEILEQIPDNWADDITKAELESRAKEMWVTVVLAFAEQMGVKTTGSTAKIIARIAKKQRLSKKQETAALKNTCIQNAKIDIFTERYGHLFAKDENGELSLSIPMLRKITELPLGELYE